MRARNLFGTEFTSSITWTLQQAATRQAVWYVRWNLLPFTSTHTVYVNGALAKTVNTQRMLPWAFSAATLTPTDGQRVGEMIVTPEILSTDSMAAIEAYWSRYP